MKTFLVKVITEKGSREMRITLEANNPDEAKLELFKQDFHENIHLIKIISITETTLQPTIAILNKKINYIY